MELFHPKKINFNFTKIFNKMLVVSAILVVVSLVLFAVKGLNLGIDFKGGVQSQVSFTDTSLTDGTLRSLFGDKLVGLTIQQTTASDSSKKGFLISSQADKNESSKIINSTLTSTYGAAGGKWTLDKVDFVGPKIGSSLKRGAFWSLFFICIFITIYIYWRFDLRFAPGAIACIFHDLIITTGILALLGIEFTTTIVAALLTLAGYSINDTVVVFDRVRESEEKLLGKTKEFIVDNAINACLSRTIVTSFTTLISCAVLFFIGGPAIQPFAGTLFVGICIGTYSSIFLACPLFLKANDKLAPKLLREQNA